MYFVNMVENFITLSCSLISLAVGASCLLLSAGITMYVPTGFGRIIDIVTTADSTDALLEYSYVICRSLSFSHAKITFQLI